MRSVGQKIAQCYAGRDRRQWKHGKSTVEGIILRKEAAYAIGQRSVNHIPILSVWAHSQHCRLGDSKIGREGRKGHFRINRMLTL